MKFVNYTPHEVTIVREDTPPKVTDITPYVIKRIPSSGEARLETFRERVQVLNDIPIYRISYGKLTPPIKPEHDTGYIVSSVICTAIRRDDFYAPDTSPASAVRNPEGVLLGVKGLIKCSE